MKKHEILGWESLGDDLELMSQTEGTLYCQTTIDLYLHSFSISIHGTNWVTRKPMLLNTIEEKKMASMALIDFATNLLKDNGIDYDEDLKKVIRKYFSILNKKKERKWAKPDDNRTS